MHFIFVQGDWLITVKLMKGKIRWHKNGGFSSKSAIFGEEGLKNYPVQKNVDQMKKFCTNKLRCTSEPFFIWPKCSSNLTHPQFYHLAHRQLNLSLVSILEFVQSFTTLPLTSPICHYSVFWHTPSFLPLHLTSSICHFFQQGFSASLGFLISFIERKSQVYEIRLPWNWTCNWILHCLNVFAAHSFD